jgi:predicted nucleic acid-binding protein
MRVRPRVLLRGPGRAGRRGPRAAIALPSIETVDPDSLLRALVLHEVGLDFAEAYLVAQAETTGVGEVVSFDRAIARVGTVAVREP